MSAATEITTLVYRYAELMDAGDLEAEAALLGKTASPCITANGTLPGGIIPCSI